MESSGTSSKNYLIIHPNTRKTGYIEITKVVGSLILFTKYISALTS